MAVWRLEEDKERFGKKLLTHRPTAFKNRRLPEKKVWTACPFRARFAALFDPMCAGVAQSVEQGTENPCVGSSILSPGTTLRPCQMP
jgi:hypothetical protein